MCNEIEERLKLTCSWCFLGYRFLKLHKKEANNCPTNCLKAWQQLLHDHYQEQIMLYLAQENHKNHD